MVNPLRHTVWRAALAACVALGGLVPGAAFAQQFYDLLTHSNSVTSTADHLCYSTDGGVTLACPTTAPYLTSGGLLGIGTNNPTTALEVSGTISATAFVGDGSGLTNVVAASSDRIVSGTSKVIVNNGGNVDFMTGSTLTGYYTPGGILTSVGVSTTDTISATSIYAGNFGTSGSLVYRDSNGKLTGSSGVTISGSSIQIGGASASQGSGLYANGQISAAQNLYAGVDVLALGNVYAPAGYGFSRWQTSDLIGGSSSSHYITFTTSGTEAMRIVSTGYVGIGTSAPDGLLSLSGGNIRFSENSTVRSLSWGMLSSSNKAFISGRSGASSFLSLGTNNIDRFVIDVNGNSGFNIGTATPSTTLHVSGTVRIADGGEACDANRAGAIKYTNSSNAFYFCDGTNGWRTIAQMTGTEGADRIISGTTSMVASSATGIISITQNATNTAYFHPSLGLVTIGVSSTGTISGTAGYFSGKVGIGTNATQPAYPLDVGGNARVTGVLYASQINSAIASQYLTFTTSNVEAMRIVSTGYVGIGTATPRAMMQVSGAIQISGDGTEGCTGSTDAGKIRRDPTTGHLQICK